MPSWTEAIQAVPGGVSLQVEASTGARDERFPDGYNPWRRRLGVRVRAQAQGGLANEAIVRVVAAFFRVAPGAVHVDAGHLDSRKRLTVAGVPFEHAVALLEKALSAER